MDLTDELAVCIVLIGIDAVSYHVGECIFNDVAVSVSCDVQAILLLNEHIRCGEQRADTMPRILVALRLPALSQIL